MASSRIERQMQHVYRHADDYLLESKMSPAQRVNFWADKLAMAALIVTVKTNRFISIIFLLEKVSEEWVTGSPRNAIMELRESK